MKACNTKLKSCKKVAEVKMTRSRPRGETPVTRALCSQHATMEVVAFLAGDYGTEFHLERII